ncbi:peptidase M29 aminopeptidase II [Desulfofarcimen acetoxidans DSM 771]|uniref:Peptidase M29 aminopeptidase II n=1 Tax=Desulfofarcimen acetoxidans (strain ATCC 49208 / DSM 771 / KCTC 5769 / VKM B-1644 / 5575) TaxID=485916 RepID=C8VWI4_DESAS|nr:aminopeptidase [Desulfofarcimen acetoxidans]ACV64348.1 peptidase M29 aminopeptidase II [Desulfofarcimen acetoxidans DSM 771]
MVDPRIITLARNLVNYSCDLQPGEKILIEAIGLELPFVKELIKEVCRVGGVPFVTIKDNSVNRSLLINASEEQLKMMAKYEAARMEDMDAYIGIRSGNNSAELSDVPQDKLELYNKYFINEVHMKIRVPKTKWVVLRYPSPSMSQLANTSIENFENFYFNVCNLDYEKMSQAMTPLVELMNKTDKVRIVGTGTDLTFSIKSLPAIKCAGKRNIPDGEVFSAPVKDSVNGYITYNTPAQYQGFTYENIRLEFKDGKIVQATANDTEKINKVFDTDKGARYVGEFALGVNPYITKPMKDTLFDEKIAGSIHFTPGSAYDECFNGNKSAIHWDLVYIQTLEYGGGEIYFDDVLIRKDGRFVIPQLEGLNPENLK